MNIAMLMTSKPILLLLLFSKDVHPVLWSKWRKKCTKYIAIPLLSSINNTRNDSLYYILLNSWQYEGFLEFNLQIKSINSLFNPNTKWNDVLAMTKMFSRMAMSGSYQRLGRVIQFENEATNTSERCYLAEYQW
jgi:hypothetical protein